MTSPIDRIKIDVARSTSEDLRKEIIGLNKLIKRQKKEIHYHLQDKDKLYKEIDKLEEFNTEDKKDALEWFNWIKEQCESEGFKDVNKIPELIRKSREQNKKYKKLKSNFEELNKKLIDIKVEKFNEGYNQAIKDYEIDKRDKGSVSI